MNEELTEIPADLESLSYKIIGLAIEVHRQLGPGLLESAYQHCLCYEIKKAGLKVEKELTLPILYKDIKLDHGYRIDLLIEDRLVIELKTVESFTSVHFAQILTYLRLGNYPLGLLINYNSKILKNNIKRFINSNSDL
jgi:GxxExxY protein